MITQATALSSDPVMRAAEVQALKDQIEYYRKRQRLARSLEYRPNMGSTQRRIAKEIADDIQASADDLQRRLDELERT